MNIEYFSDFPGHARAKVDHAVAEAELSFAKDGCRSVQRVVDFVLDIFEVFLSEFTAIVNQQSEGWTAEAFRNRIEGFLDQIIDQAHKDKRPSSLLSQRTSLFPGNVTYRDMLGAGNTGATAFRARVREELATSPSWLDYQQTIQTLAAANITVNDSASRLRIEKLVSVQKAADLLGVHEDTVRRLQDRETIGLVRIGRQRRVRKSDIERLLATGDYPKRRAVSQSEQESNRSKSANKSAQVRRSLQT